MRKWVVTFEGLEPGEEGDFDLEFVDAEEALGRYISFKPIVIERLLELVKLHDHYQAIENIKRIRSPASADVNLKDYIVILSIDVNGLKFGLLINVENKEKPTIIGLWPGTFAGSVSKNIRILAGYIAFLIDRPDNWRRVDYVSPIA